MTILAAVDLSPVSIDAARAAVSLARCLGDDLLLLRVIEPLPAEPGLTALGAEDAPAQDAALAALRNLRVALGADDIGVELRVVAGRPAEAIVDCARSSRARLVVMGTHGRKAAARLLLGSVTQATIAGSPCPVLAIRAGAAPFAEWAAGRRPLRLVAGIDRGGTGAALLSFLDQLRVGGPTDVTLVHEFWPAREYARLGLRAPRDLRASDPRVVDILERELRHELGGREDVTLLIEAVSGSLPEQLGSGAEAENADLLVLGRAQPAEGEARGSLAERLAEKLVDLRSTALAALAATEVPILVVPLPRPAQPPRAKRATPSPKRGLGQGHGFGLRRAAGVTLRLAA